MIRNKVLYYFMIISVVFVVSCHRSNQVQEGSLNNKSFTFEFIKDYINKNKNPNGLWAMLKAEPMKLNIDKYGREGEFGEYRDKSIKDNKFIIGSIQIGDDFDNYEWRLLIFERGNDKFIYKCYMVVTIRGMGIPVLAVKEESPTKLKFALKVSGGGNSGGKNYPHTTNYGEVTYEYSKGVIHEVKSEQYREDDNGKRVVDDNY